MPPLQCPMCMKNTIFLSEEYMERHLCELHFECRPYVCDYCNGLYSTQAQLKDLERLPKVASQLKLAKEKAPANDAPLVTKSSITCDSAGPVGAAAIPTSGGGSGGVLIKLEEKDEHSQPDFAMAEQIADELLPQPMSPSPPVASAEQKQPQPVHKRVRNHSAGGGGGVGGTMQRSSGRTIYNTQRGGNGVVVEVTTALESFRCSAVSFPPEPSDFDLAWHSSQ